MLSTPGLFVVGAILVISGCVPLTPADPNPRGWPAHDGLRCIEVPDAQCEEMAGQAEMNGMSATEPIRGVTVVCTRPEGCTDEVGAGEAFVHHTDGSGSEYGWGYGTADGPPPAPPPGLEQPRSPAEIECILVPQLVCDSRVDDVYLGIQPGAAQPTKIQVACAPGVACTEESAEGTTMVVYPDGRVERSNWGIQAVGEPPPAP
jgi:hypothetical protein